VAVCARPPGVLRRPTPALQDIAAVALQHRVDGLIVGNTTITRPGKVRSGQVGLGATRPGTAWGYAGEGNMRLGRVHVGRSPCLDVRLCKLA
jgi:hypothetical protein